MDYLLFATRNGTVKRTSSDEYGNIRQSGLVAINLSAKDELLTVKATTGNSLVLLVSQKGKCILFDEEDVRPTGRSTQGVRGILLKNDDKVVGMATIEKNEYKDKTAGELIIITANGYGKASKLSGYSVQGRGGQGVFTAKVTSKTGQVVAMRVIKRNDAKTAATKRAEETTDIVDEYEIGADLLVTSAQGQTIRLPLDDVPTLGRQTQGVRIIKLNSGDQAKALAIL
ncbi:hypothetical protein CO180_04160 [candidate division WWE3 bacterium CG_4_9_14_3_um_filter_41_6]|uniref:DNA gyrase subunit A n=1 Tax=candidate division WWE3 bacterium CG_4_10_14_0_2_um_filter_41_14 TaxID=1975072 RepID=A0A2M7TG75_UNCKA|nr:MAG: hypothetical protein COY32_05775 [candidate division WWE3 bacterium CG_4_10_14_0_2_um_filter_41_14]PJA38160.1 MAG: hypothetical protein CO180_04160 [candidate division WWE3 bacterium CG_4_9_14_3_um_filter_41_6]